MAGLLVYGYAINLPYHIDDFVHFRWLSERTLPEVWASAAGLANYRPVPFTVWKVVYWLSGGYPPQIIHSINVVCHALNGVLVFALVRLHQGRTPAGLMTGFVAAVLFLLFPFSYQAVPWAGALTHPLVTLLMLGALVLAVQAAERQAAGTQATEQRVAEWRFIMKRVIALALALIAPFVHETGVLIAFLLTLFYLTMTHRKGLRDVITQTWPYWVCSLVALVAVLVLRGDVGTVSSTLESLWQNAVYFLQGLMYPVAPLGRRLMAMPDGVLAGLNDLGAVLIVCVPVLLVLAILYVRSGMGRLTVFALGWYAVVVAPAWLLLGFNYVVDGPRLMYGASVGAAIFWAIPVCIVANRWAAIQRRWGRIAAASPAALVVIGTCLGSIGFLSERADMYEQTRITANDMLRAVAQPTTDPRAVLSINFPGWIAPTEPVYVLGHEGVAFIPDYSSPMDLVWTMRGQTVALHSIVLPELQSHWRFNYRNYGSELKTPDVQPRLREFRQILFTSSRWNDLVTYDVGGLEAQNMPQALQYTAAFSGQLALLSGEWRTSHDTDASPRTLQVTLYWQSWQPLTQEVRTYVHLLDEAGQLVAQEDGLPLMGVANPLWWQPGDRWRDMRPVELPADLKGGKYTLRVGVYPAADGSRYPAVGPDGQRFENDSAFLGVVELP